MSWLLNLLYLLAAAVAAPWLLWAAVVQGKYRHGWSERLWGQLPPRVGDRPAVWFHAASLGEVNLLATLIPPFERAFPEYECLITTVTPAGHEQALARFPGKLVAYAPLDFSWAVAEAFDRWRPSLLVMAELEVWPNLLAEARRRAVPAAIVNGRLSDRSFRNYQWLGPLARGMFAQLDLVAAQNSEYADRFTTLGVPGEQVHETGSIKFDGARTDRQNDVTNKLRRLAGIADDDLVFLAGSTQADEEPLLLATYRELAAVHPRLRMILVPRHPHRFDETAALLDSSGMRWQRRSQLPAPPSGDSRESSNAGAPAPRVLLVDTVGELGGWWGTAHIAYVGGSMGSRGGQNMIEPAAYGAAVSFGPRTENFRDVVAMLLAAEAAVVVDDGASLTAFVRRCLEAPDEAAALGRRAQELVLAQRGACQRTVELLGTLLSENRTASALLVPAPADSSAVESLRDAA